MKRNCVLIVGFGAPSHTEEGVRDFLRELWNRDVPDAVVKAVFHKYKVTNPPLFSERIKGLARDIERLTGIEVRYSFFFTPPFFREVVREDKNWLILPISPLHSKWFEKLIEKECSSFKVIRNWGLNQNFVELCVKLINGREMVLFTYHSLPPEEEEYRRSAFNLSEKIAERAGVKHWKVAFQSGRENWLSPSIEDAISEFVDEVTVFPVGFMFECVETYYDLDIVLSDILRKRGVKYKRISPPGEHPEFINFISKLVKEMVE